MRKLSAHQLHIDQLMSVTQHTIRLIEVWSLQRPYSDIVYRSTRYAHNLPYLDTDQTISVYRDPAFRSV